MTTTRITIEPGNASQAGRVDVARVDATTEAQIARHMEADEQLSMLGGSPPVCTPSEQAVGAISLLPVYLSTVKLQAIR